MDVKSTLNVHSVFIELVLYITNMSVSGDLFLQLLVTLITYKASVVCTHLITETQSEA